MSPPCLTAPPHVTPGSLHLDITARPSSTTTMAKPLSCDSVERLHAAHRYTQRLLSHELAAGDQREL
eukprot:SAG11_NODE_23816_length_382_cov_4.113074_1_plen_66_part_01